MFSKPVEVLSVESEISTEILIKHEGVVSVHVEECLLHRVLSGNHDNIKGIVRHNDLGVSSNNSDFELVLAENDLFSNGERSKVSRSIDKFKGEFGRIDRVVTLALNNAVLIEL